MAAVAGVTGGAQHMAAWQSGQVPVHQVQGADAQGQWVEVVHGGSANKVCVDDIAAMVTANVYAALSGSMQPPSGASPPAPVPRAACNRFGSNGSGGSWA